MDRVDTTFIVLRKTPYGETSLIVSSLSTEYGKLDFIISGARKVSKRSFPVIDLFREIKGSCMIRDTGLNKVYTPELLSNYDSIVSNPDNYMTACDIARFITANTQPMVSVSMLYSSLRRAFSCLSAGEVNVPWLTLVKLVYLYEQGLLPDTLGGAESREAEEQKARLLENIITFAISGGELNVDNSYWPLFSSWIDSLCSYNGVG